MTINHDPQEDDPAISVIIEQATREAEENLAGFPKMLGYCHAVWGQTKEILKEKYNIDWKTPAEMNPHILFD